MLKKKKWDKQSPYGLQGRQITTLAWEYEGGLFTTSEEKVCGMFWNSIEKGSIWTFGEVRKYFCV